MQPTLEIAMRQPESLIQSALKSLVKQEDTQIKFIDLMLSKIEAFMTLYGEASVLSTKTYDKFVEIFNTEPEGLEDDEREGYAVYLHHLIKEGVLYGMTQEDPYTAMTLVGSSIKILRELVVDHDRSDLLPMALDMMMLQSIAISAAGGDTLAETGLTQILKVAQSKEDIEREFGVDCDHSVYKDIQMRAALCALMLSSILEDLLQKKKAEAARTLAKSMFKEMMENKKIHIGTQDKLIVMVSLAELAAYEGNMKESSKFLVLAIDCVEKELKNPACGTPYVFLASIVFRKMASYESAENSNYSEAERHFNKAVELAERCCKAYPANTHYQDHHGEVLNDLGVLLGVTGNFLTSNDAFIKSIENRRKLVGMSKQYNMSLIAALSNISVLMQKFGQWEVAKQYLQEAVDLLDAEEQVSLPTEAIKIGLKMALQELKQHHNPKTSLWTPLNNPNKYGAN